MLRDLIAGLRDEFDFIVLDSPPGKAMLAFNALSAADELIIPLPAERPALDGVQDLLRFIHEVVWDKYNPGLKIRGILPAMFKKTTTHSAGVVGKAREIWGDKVFPLEVPESIAFPRAYTAGRPLPLYDPQHEGTLAYRAVARRLYTAPERPPTPETPAPAGEGTASDTAPEPVAAPITTNDAGV